MPVPVRAPRERKGQETGTDRDREGAAGAVGELARRAWRGATRHRATRHGVLPWLRRGAVAGAVMVLVAALCVAVQLVAPAPASAAGTPVPGAAASWPFSEGSGTTTADSSGNGHTGTLGSGVTWAAPEAGAHSIATNGTAAGAVTVPGPVVNTAASYTVSAWVYLNAIGGGNQTFVSINGASPTTSSTISGFYLLFQGGSDQFDFVMYNSDSSGSGVVNDLSTILPKAGTWYHLVGVDNVSAGTLSLYVNGALQASAAYTGSWQATGNTMIGQSIYNGSAADFVSGKIDDVAFYSSALTAAQVAALNPPVIATGLTTTCEISSGNASCWGDNSTGTLGDNSTYNSSVPVPVYTGGVLAGLTLTQINVGSDFACALSSAGSAYCWGFNSSGQLGNGTTVSSNVPVAVSGGLTFTQLETGALFACGLTSAGAAYCWGNDSNDQLGNTTLLTNSSVPVAVTGSHVFAQISAGTGFACALTTAAAAYCWGSDANGQIGNASAANPQPSPLAVTTSGALSGVTLTQISAALGGSTTCALSSAGAAYCWGLGSSGQLGNGSTTAAQATAVAVTTSGVLSGVTLTQISGGQDQTCALGSTAVAYCWGGNTDGDLGINSTTRSLVPAAVSTAGVLSGKFLTQISASGSFFTCAIGSFGAAYCWGLNSLGQAGNPDTADNFPVPVSVAPSQATMMAAGYTHSCVLFYGGAHCWGDNTYGELGDNSTVSSTSAVPVAAGAMPGGTVLVQVTNGNDFSCALSAAGAVYCWGQGTSGQLGNGASVQSNVPVLVSGGLTFTGISAGGSSACGVTSAGAAYCWGLGTSGQLGNTTTTSSNVPVPVAGGLTVTQVSAGGSAACALATTGAAFCWGAGASGQLGNGGTSGSSQPVAVSAPAVGGAVAYSEVSAGGAFACAVSAAGAEYCWGDDTYGELGNSTTTSTPQSTPVAVTTSGVLSGVTVTQIAAGYDHACALSAAGAAYCWGLGTSGQLGNHASATSSVPVAVYTAGVLSGRELTQVSAGQYHTCALDNQNTGYCWGLNSSGQDGRADTGINFNAPESPEAAGLDLITTGYTHSCVIRSGNAYCWGANTYGQLGDNSTVSSSVPVPVYTGGALAGVTLVQLVAGNGYTCALSAGGAAYCWGYNADGELGNNSTASSSVPVAVNTSGVLSGLTLTEITAGQYAACGLSSGGAVYCWGRGTSGQLGNNGTTSSSVPVAVSASGIVFSAVDAGGAFACAVSTAATAYCWGANASGQLGNSTTTASSVPVLVNLPGTYVLAVTAGFNHACLVSGTTSVVIYCWGDDTYGELGNGTTTTTPQSTPVTLAASSALTSKSLAELNAGYQSTCATDTAGLAYCWGANNDGQVGNNTTATASAPVAVTATGVLAGKDITEIAPGQYDTCALDSNGAAYCWGLNGNGQAGNPDTAVNYLVPVAVSPSQAVTIAAGYTTTCEISSGHASCWGDNSTGTLGDNSIYNSSVPVPVYTGGVLAGLTLTQISVGSKFACALSSAGSAYCWGNNSNGNLGNNSTTQSLVPVTVSGGLTFTQISAGNGFVCALTSAGAAYCWGSDATDQLGNTTLLTNSAVPVAVTGGLAFTQISAGNGFACAVTTAGAAYCWGSDANGQIGNAAAANPQTTPLAVTTSGALSGVTLTQISAAQGGGVATGGATACALSSAGAAYCWGLGSSGQLGNGSTTAAQATAVAVTTSGVLSGVTLTQISGQQNQTCALGSTAVAYCWGGNTDGDLGINSTAQSLVPAAVSTAGVLSGKFLTQISASGSFFTCAIGSFGAAYCWGLNTLGQLGNPDTLATTTGYFPVPVAVSPSQATTIAAGYTHSCVLFHGSASCWGDNTYGELGNNSTVSSATPVQVAAGAVPAGTVLVQVTTGSNFSCALSAAGDVYCWGLGTSGQLGNGASVQSDVPVLVSGGLTFTGISAGGSSACGVTSAGAAYCWGLGTSGQLGNTTTTSSSSPVAVYTAGVLSGLTVTQVSAGGSAACALATTGAAFCWGAGASGQLGNGGISGSSQPVAVSAPAAGAVAYSEVSAGGAFACAVSGAGAEYCWGDDTYGELGNSTTTSTPQSTPVAVTTSGVLSGVTVTQIAAGYDHACALSAAGAGYCWGLGTSGQLGNHASATSSVPVAVYTAGVLSGRELNQVSAGQYHTCALDNQNTGYCWGLNSSGQVGRADTGTNFNAPVTIEPAGLDLLTAGYTHSCVIRGGNAYCWGANTYGQLGDNSTIASTSPVPVYTGGALSGVSLVQVVAGNGYTCALSAGGAAYCWGYNADGELGNNSTASSSVPVAVTTSGVLNGVTLTQLTAGQYAACGLSSAGAVYCWGLGTSGQLGNNSTTSSSVPVAVSGGIAFTQLDAGGAFACAVSTAGAAYCWGANASGQLGNSTTTASSVPVAVNLSGVYVVYITAGFNHACLISDTTSFVDYCWGDDTYGELGNGTTTTTPQSTPVTVTITGALNGKSVSQINAGYQGTCATDSTGVAYCWGENNDGQVGNKTTTTASAPVAVTATGVLAGKNITEIAPGQYDTCALDSSGNAYCWGLNTLGQVGNPATAVKFLVPVAVSPPQATQAATGTIHTCELSSGKAYCWGDNSNGELGTNSTMTSSAPVATWTGGTLSGVTLTEIAAGTNFSCALSAVGAAYCWGLGTSGQLGNNSTVSSTVPVPVYTGGVLSGVTLTQITAGSQSACAVSSTGAAYCWGAGGNGELGNGSTAPSSVPVAVTTSGVLSGVSLTEVSVGNNSACAVGAGAAYCWGYDGYGQLGNNTTGNAQSTPVAVTTSGTPLAQVVVTGITEGDNYTCALSSAGAAYCWGGNGDGQLGNNSTTESNVPTAVYTAGALSGVTLSQVDSGSDSSCALSTAGGGYCWGANDDGQLGNGTTTNSSVPVVVSPSNGTPGLTVTEVTVGAAFECVLVNSNAHFCNGDNSNGQLGNPATAGSFSSPTAVMSTPTVIATGYSHACLLRNGKAYCWGDDTYGELGNNTTTTTPVSTPVPVYTGGVLAGLTLIQISAGQDWTCALASTGNAYCWGNNNNGTGDQVALGNNTSTASSAPVLVSGGLFFTQISVGGDFACGLTSAGVAYCWGNGGSGQLGDGATTVNLVPGTVTATSGGVLYQLTLTQIDAGSGFACALASSGAGACWGLGTSGQLGNSASASSSTPVAVTGASFALAPTQAPTGGTSACALTAAGAAYCWGAGGSGQLGNGSTTAIANTPVPVAGSHVFAQASAGTSFACALDFTGLAYCWGLGTPGDQLGNNLNASSTVPSAVTTTGVLAGVSLSQISSGQASTCTQDTTGAFYCWGTNTSGQLGNASTTSSDVPVVVQGIVPGAPTGVSATPGNTTATIAWTAPASLGTGTLTGYTATATAASGTFTCTTTSAVSCVITGLANNTTYSVTVVTMTTDGNSPPSSPAVNVTPVGILGLTSPTSLTWAVTGTGLNQAAVDGNSGDQQLTATDTTATGAGWHITVSATTFTTGPKSLPDTGAVDFTGSVGSSVASTAPSATCVGSCTLPTDTTAYPVVMTTAGSTPTVYTVYDTSVSTGEGVMTIGGSTAANPIGWWVRAPAATYAGLYTSTVTLEVVSGP